MNIGKKLIQIGLFILFTAMIWGVFSLTGSGGAGSVDVTRQQGSVESIGEEITDGWATREDFDATLYNRQLTEIEQYLTSGIIDATAKSSLVDRVNKEAYTRAMNGINRELDRDDCDGSLVKVNADGLNMIIDRFSGISKLPGVNDTRSLAELYFRAQALADKEITMQPRFNASTGGWSPDFRRHAEGLLSEQRQITSDLRYMTRLAHIESLKPMQTLPQRLNDASETFYVELAGQVNRHFTNESAAADWNRETALADFDKVYERITRDAASSKVSQILNKCKREIFTEQQ